MMDIKNIRRVAFGYCESQREGREDRQAYDEFIGILQSIIFELHRRRDAIKEDMEHDET